jgi:LuxR family maltose regulon positive regulatory protein
MYLANLNFIYWIDADLVALRQNAERSLKIAMDSGQTEAIALCIYFLGIACYHQNNLQIAEEKLTTMAQDFYFHHPVAFAHSSFALALIYQSKGKISKARKVCENLMNYAIDTNDQDLLQLARSFNAELSLRLGRLGEASHWAKRFHAKPFLPQYFFYMPQLVLIKVLMSQGTKDSQQQATDLLNQLNDFFESIHNRIFRIHVLALQALHYDTLGERPVALEKLAKALDLAEPGGFIRLFVDLGPQMADLLKQLIKQNVAMGYIGRILDAIREDEHKAMQDESEHIVAQSQPLSTQPLVETLTNRELEILELVTQRLQTKEIAEKLSISTETVNTHLKNIYRKLNVHNRRQAATRAKDLGIL